MVGQLFRVAREKREKRTLKVAKTNLLPSEIKQSKDRARTGMS
jgi:hypothetical protein